MENTSRRLLYPDNAYMNVAIPKKKRTLPVWNILKILLATGLIVYVLSKTNLSIVAETLQSASIPWLVVSTVLFIFVTLLKTLQYYSLMRDELSYSQVLNLIIWQNAISNYLLTGAGVATYITMTRMEHEIKVSRSVTTFLLTKAGDLTAIWSALLVSTILLWSQMNTLQLPVLALLLVIGMVVVAFFLTVFLRQGFVSFLTTLLDRTGLSKFRFAGRAVTHLQSLANMDQNKTLRLFGSLILYSFAYLIVTLIWSYASLAIFHLYMDPVPFIFISVLMQLVSYFPVSVFGGLGIAETSSLYFWGFFQVSPDMLAPALIGVRVVFYVVNLIPLIYLPIYAIHLKSKITHADE